MNKSQGLIGKLTGLFSSKIDPEQVRKSLRTQEKEISRKLYEIEYDQKRNRKERDQVIQKGVNAARSSDSTQEREAAYDLKAIKAEIADLDRTRRMLVKSRLFCRMSRRRLEKTAPDGSLEVVKKVNDLLNDDRISEMLTDAKVTEEQFYDTISRRIGVELAELEEGMDHGDEEIMGEMELFEAAADGEEQGNESQAREAYSQLKGEGEEVETDPLAEL
jgi:hypothetical protein